MSGRRIYLSGSVMECQGDEIDVREVTEILRKMANSQPTLFFQKRTSAPKQGEIIFLGGAGQKKRTHLKVCEVSQLEK